MIDNVFTINDHRKEGLKRFPEYWQSADYEGKVQEVMDRILNTRGFVPRANMKILREISFMVKSSTTVEQLLRLADNLRDKYQIDCFQISVDRSESTAHLFASFVGEDGCCVKFDWLTQIKVSALILRVLNLPRPKSVKMWLRYFLIDFYESDPMVFKKQLEYVERGEIAKVNLGFMRDVMQYAEAMCKGQLK